MGWILDVAIIFFLLLGVGIGAWRGFIGSLAKMLSGVLRLVVSILLARPLVSLIKLTTIDEQMFDKFSKNIVIF